MATEPQEWEYRIYTLFADHSDETWQNEMNFNGTLKWELVSIIQKAGNFLSIYKRPK